MVVSPLLTNVYLHYSFNLWVNVWRQKWAQGEVVIVRYVDDTIVGFQYQTDADAKEHSSGSVEGVVSNHDPYSDR